MEVIGLALGVVPLIVAALRSYESIREFKSQFAQLDRRLESVLTEINIAENLFRIAIDGLLVESVGKDSLNASDEDWTRAGIVLPSLLDDRSRIVVTQFTKDMVKVLEDIEVILFSLNHNGSVISRVGTRVVFSLASVVPWFRWIRPRRIKIARLIPMGPGKKLEVVANGTIKKLEALRQKMKTYNDDLYTVLSYALLRNVNRHSPSAVSRDSRTTRTLIESSTIETSTGLRNVQTSSKNLHKVFRELRTPCQCHLLHLCLDNMAMVSATAPVSEPIAQLCYLLPKSEGYKHSLPNSGRPVSYLVLSCHEFNLETPPPDDVYYWSNFGYEELSDECFKKSYHVGGTADIERMGFTLQRANTLGCSTVASLHDISSAGKLKTLGCFQIAAGLARSVLLFYDSPWIQDWTLKTIHCYNKSANPNQELWIPYVPVGFSSNVEGRKINNTEIHSLGLILLELGRKQPLENVDGDVGGDDDKTIFEMALWDLHGKMGKRYRKVVENFIQKWGDGDLDLMAEENFNGFSEDIVKLEELVEDFSPRSTLQGRAANISQI